jgi:hypothetical protein
MPPPFQFSIQIVQQDVGQQRREYAPNAKGNFRAPDMYPIGS